MLLLALALFLVGLASLAATTGGPATPAAARSTHRQEVATSEAWRAAAIGADADAKELRLAIAFALDERDARRRDRLLRAALVRTAGPVPVRITL